MRNLLVIHLLTVCCCALTADFTPQLAASLISDVQHYYHSSCVYVITSSVITSRDTKLATLWREVSRQMEMGVLPVHHLLQKTPYLCTTQLYVVLDRDLHILNEVSSAGLFFVAKWLVFSRSAPQFSHLYVPFDCELLVAQYSGEVVRLDEVYRVSREMPLQVRHFGDWRPGAIISWPVPELYRRRNSLDGYPIKTVVLDDGTYTFVDWTKSRQRFGGFIGHVWKELVNKMNCTTHLLPSIDGGTGAERNGSWDGMIGMLVRGEAEIGASTFVMTKERLAVVDFTYGLVSAPNNVYIRRPDVYSLPWTSSLAPFTPRLWFCVLGTMVLLTLALSTTCKIERRYDNGEEAMFSLRDSWLCMLGIFCQQGHHVTPRTPAARVVYFTSYICAIVLLAGYAGNYISFLSAGRPLVLPFTSFRGMIDDGSYRLGVKSSTAQLDFFDNATDPLFREVYEKLIAPGLGDLPDNNLVAFKRVCASKYAFMSSLQVQERFAETVDCKLIKIPDASIPAVDALTTSKHSPYRGIINHNLQRMRNGAILKLIEQRMLKRKEPIEPKAWDTIGLDEVAPTLSFFCLGALLSLLVLLVECSMNRMNRRHDATLRITAAFQKDTLTTRNVITEL